ncbi:hypothetical protein PHMEG_00017735, partial [Phytophthora megakarya]
TSMPRPRGRGDISPDVRLRVALFLAERSVRGRLFRGAIKSAVAAFGIGHKSVKKIWQMRSNVEALSVSRRVQPARGRRLTVQEVVELVQAVPLCQRQTQRALSAASGIPRTTLQRYLADGSLRKASSRVKPTLTPAHKTKRLQWALAHVKIPLGTVLFCF